jgi:hypothetical protein
MMLKKLAFTALLVLLSGLILAFAGWPYQAAAQNPTPIPPTYGTTRAAFFPFERGYMFWLEDVDQIYVLAYGTSELDGQFSVYPDLWQEGMPETDPAIVPPPGFFQPDRGFGLVWRTYPAVREALGWGRGTTHGYTALVVRDNGRLMIACPDNRVYDLAGAIWHSIDYYYKPLE